MPCRPDGAPVPPQSHAAALKIQGAAIERARLARGLSQPAAALELGVAAATLQNWEQGRRGCPEEIRARIVAEWGADGKELSHVEGKCPCCGRPY
jgi:DNA-binding transcriptional regulator YiaG